MQTQPDDLMRRGSNMTALLPVLTLAMSQDDSRLKASDMTAAATADADPVAAANITHPWECAYRSLEWLFTAVRAGCDQSLSE